MIDSTLDLVGVSSSRRKAGLGRHPVKEALKQCGRGRQSTTLYTKCVCVCVCTQCVRMYIPTYKQNTVQCGRPCCVDSHCSMVLVCWLGSHFVTDKSDDTL